MYNLQGRPAPWPLSHLHAALGPAGLLILIDARAFDRHVERNAVATAAYVADAGVRTQCPANNPGPALAGRDCLTRETQDASTALIDGDVAGGDLIFVGGEGCQDFALLALRDLCEIKGAS